jgi:hypothetical protein
VIKEDNSIKRFILVIGYKNLYKLLYLNNSITKAAEAVLPPFWMNGVRPGCFNIIRYKVVMKV